MGPVSILFNGEIQKTYSFLFLLVLSRNKLNSSYVRQFGEWFAD